MFPYGLAIGACVAIVNLNIISTSIDRAVAKGKKGPVIFGFILRLLLYFGAFWLAITTSGLTGLGAAIGFLLPRIVLYISKGLVPFLKKKINKEPDPVYVTDTRSNMFIKEPSMVRSKNNRSYVTYRHYRKIRVNPKTDRPAGKRKKA